MLINFNIIRNVFAFRKKDSVHLNQCINGYEKNTNNLKIDLLIKNLKCYLERKYYKHYYKN